jgi:FkbM family methyltransferase
VKQLLNFMRKRPGFYVPSPTCQVPELAEKWEAIFGHMTDGFFVEVGAYDGESYSNTSCLADVGWSGLYVEPISEFADRCVQRHCKNSGIQVINCAASDEVGSIKVFLGDILTTVVDTQVTDYKKIGWAVDMHKGEIRDVPAAPLDIILDRNKVCPRFDLLVIDVEGAEEKVMRGFTLDRWLPKAILIELEDEHPDFCANSRVVESVTRIRSLIEDAGYALYFKDQINSLYVLKACDG